MRHSSVPLNPWIGFILIAQTFRDKINCDIKADSLALENDYKNHRSSNVKPGSAFFSTKEVRLGGQDNLEYVLTCSRKIYLFTTMILVETDPVYSGK